jgi:hypothetical protein
VSCVYVISAGPNRQKVGVANDPHVRCHELQCGSFDALEVVFAERTGAARPTEVERAAHGFLRDCNAHREWFETTPEAAVLAVKRALSGERPVPIRKPGVRWRADTPISVRVPSPLMGEIEAWARASDTTRHAAMVMLLERGLEAFNPQPKKGKAK